MSLKHWPIEERPREKLLQKGAQSLSNAELLTIIIGKGVRGKDVFSISHELLNQFGGLQGIFGASFKLLNQQAGLGPAKYCQLQASLELHRRYLQENLQRTNAFNQSAQVQHFLMSNLMGCEQEIFACLFLDAQHHLVKFEKLFFGTINHASVHPREVVKRALQYNAAGVIVTHNHPSGLAEPSRADINTTQNLKQALALVDVKLLDHIIVAGSQCVSLLERGLI